jgi:GNAT superfamily N-acetyltransferase
MTTVPSSIHLRPAADTDAAAVAALLSELGYETTPEQVRARLARVAGNDDYAAFVAEADGEVLGFLGLHRGWAYEHDRPYVRLTALVVAERARRRGVGARLVELADGWARERGAFALMLNTSVHREGAHRFYESLGFSRTGYRYARAYG